MTGQSIPLQIRNPGTVPGGNTIGGGVQAIAFEVVSALEKLHEAGQTSSIDLKSLPMAPGEFQEIRNLLGQGEIDITLDLDGPTRIRETAFAGVWWIHHADARGRVLAEHIEISRVPDFLVTPSEDITQAVKQLRARLQGATHE